MLYRRRYHRFAQKLGVGEGDLRENAPQLQHEFQVVAPDPAAEIPGPCGPRRPPKPSGPGGSLEPLDGGPQEVGVEGAAETLVGGDKNEPVLAGGAPVEEAWICTSRPASRSEWPQGRPGRGPGLHLDAKGRAAKIGVWDRRMRAAATIFMALVICSVDLTDLIFRRMSRKDATFLHSCRDHFSPEVIFYPPVPGKTLP